jgi:hypothetical protein
MHFAKRRFPVTLNLRYMHVVLNVDEIKNQLHSLVVLCETNILSLFSQRLDNYYQNTNEMLQCRYSKFDTPNLVN